MSALALQRIEGKYEILEKLREGGMGALYKVRHRLLDEIRVIKLMRQQLVDDPELKARFLREAKLAIKLRHPNIAQLYDFTVDDDGTAFIVMEFIDGLTLQEVVVFHGPPPLGFALEIAQQSLKALGYLHQRGFVHRDISPDNLMLTTDSESQPLVKLIDLGIAKILGGGQESHLTQTGAFLGKVRYAAPEQFDALGAATADARGDLYSFGIVLYELLTGRFPIQGRDPWSLIAAHMFRPPLPFAETDPHGRIPEGLREAVLRSLARKPDERFASAAEMSGALESFRVPDDVAPEDLSRLLTRPFVQIQEVSPAPPGSTQDRLDESFGMARTPAPERLLQAVPTPVPEPLLSREEQLRRHLESARRLAAAEDFEGALSELGRAAELAPGNADVQILFRELKTAQAWQKRQRRSTEALARAAATVRGHLDRGELTAAARRLEKALAAHGERAPLPELKARLESLQAQATAAEAEPTVRWAPETQRLPAAEAQAQKEPEPFPVTPPVSRRPASWKVLVSLAAGVLVVAALLLWRPASTPVPGPPATPATLILDALPWGEVVAVTDAHGKPQALGPQRYTPLVLSFPPGHYTVALRNPRSRQPVSLEADLAAGAEVRKIAELGAISEDEFFPEDGLVKTRILILAILGLAGFTSALRADYEESYRKGIAAVDQKDWPEAERWMQKAVNDNAQEGGKPVKIYGTRWEPYLPHYYLGLALFQRHDCVKALAEWQDSEKQGKVQGTAKFTNLKLSRDDCLHQIAIAKSPSTPTPTPPTRVDAAVQAQASPPATVESQKVAEVPAPVSRRGETPAPTPAARPEANQAEDRRQEIRLEIDRTAAEGRKILDKASRVPYPEADLKLQQKDLRDLLRKSAELRPNAPVADLEALQRELPAAMSRLEALLPGQTGPPAELRAAARAFLRGDYQGVVRTLAAARYQEKRAVLTRNLLLAAAHYSLYLEVGEKDAKLRQQALDDVRACRRLDPRLVPDADAFSPRFREFFRTAS